MESPELIMPGSRVRVPPLLSCEASLSHRGCGAFFMCFLGVLVGWATTRATTAPPFLCIALGGDALPPIALRGFSLEEPFDRPLKIAF